MPLRRFNRNLRPVNSIKHVVDRQFAIALGVNHDSTLVQATDTPTLAATDEVETGSRVSSVYLKVECVNTGTAGLFANAYMIIYKNPGGTITVPAANLVGASNQKRYVIHQEMVMLQFVDNSNPRTLFNGVIRIPRGYARFGPADVLGIRIISPGVELSVCFQCHYKEYR